MHAIYSKANLKYKLKIKSNNLQEGIVDIYSFAMKYVIEPMHEISNNVVCATSKASDQPVHRGSLIRAFASRLHIL